MTKSTRPNREYGGSRTSHGNDGFTLIEVVVTLALVAALSMIMVAMITQFRSIVAARERNDARIEVEALAGFMAETIGSARAFPLSRDNPQQRLMMTGGGSELTFVAASRIGSRNYGLRDVSIYVDRASGSRGQELLMQSLQMRRTDDQLQPEVVELAPIDEFRLRYWKRDAEPRSSQGAWMDKWSEPGELPLLVGFSIAITRSGQRVSAERIVRLLAGPR